MRSSGLLQIQQDWTLRVWTKLSALLPTVTRSVLTGTPSHATTMLGLEGASLAAAAPTFIVTVHQRMIVLLMMSKS